MIHTRRHSPSFIFYFAWSRASGYRLRQVLCQFYLSLDIKNYASAHAFYSGLFLSCFAFEINFLRTHDEAEPRRKHFFSVSYHILSDSSSRSRAYICHAHDDRARYQMKKTIIQSWAGWKQIFKNFQPSIVHHTFISSNKNSAHELESSAGDTRLKGLN